MIAASLGYTDVVKYLVSWKDVSEPIDVANNNGLNPLMVAACEGHINVVTALLKNGEDVDQLCTNGSTALILVCQLSPKGKVNRLSDAKARISQREIVSLLLEYGASVERTDSIGFTALMHASYMGRTEVVALLFEKGAKLDQRDLTGSTALNLACLNGQYAVARYLIASGAAIDTTDNYGATPLMRAAVGRNTQEVSNASARNYARLKSYTNVAKLLLNTGANVKPRRKDGTTALHVACFNGCVEIAAALIEHRAAIEQTDKRGYTPLHLASRHGHTSAIALLMKNGIDGNTKVSTSTM